MSHSSALADGGGEQAAQGPMPLPVSAAQNPLPTPAAAGRADSPADARGRKILSTAFVRVGPDGQLTVELHGGRTLVLRDVRMEAAEYCGRPVAGGPARKRFCGRYADVVAARPGGGAVGKVAEPGTGRAAPR